VKPHGARSRGRGEDREGASRESARGKSREQREENSIGHGAGSNSKMNIMEKDEKEKPAAPLTSALSRQRARGRFFFVRRGHTGYEKKSPTLTPALSPLHTFYLLNSANLCVLCALCG